MVSQGEYGLLKEIKIAQENWSKQVEKTKVLAEQVASVYVERNLLVAALSKLLPSWLARHPEEDKDWDNDWRWIVFIQLPTGQASWHVHDSEIHSFNHLATAKADEIGTHGTFMAPWDGHTTQEKYKRLQEMPEAECSPWG